jgi:hypothetical protein
MNPTTDDLACLDTAPAGCSAAAQPRGEADRRGFQVGWDHARHGLVPAAELLVDGTPVGQGWRAGKAVFGRRCLPTTPALRQWLGLRTAAWRAGIAFDGETVTPKWLARIAVSHCPVTRLPLGGAAGADSAPVTVCLDAVAGYRAGNLVVLSQRAAAAIPSLDLRRALRPVAGPGKPAGSGDAVAPTFGAAEQGRLVALLSQRTALPFCDAARVPLHLLPPQQLQPVNPVQVLQVLLTRQFATPGWSTRLHALADLLPADARGQRDSALRHDFNLFVGALAPRLLGSSVGSDGRTLDTELEDAWADDRVQRRWQRFAAALGEARTAELLALAAPQNPVRASGPARGSDRLGAGRGLLRGRSARGTPVAGRSTPRPASDRAPLPAPG